MRRGLYFLVSMFFMGTFLLHGFSVYAAGSDLMIYSIAVHGDTAQDEFIIIYNASLESMLLDDISIVKKTATGREYTIASQLVGEMVLPGELYVLAHKDSDVADSFVDMRYSTSIANNNALLIKRGDDVIDMVGYGDIDFFEGEPLDNTSPGECYVRTELEDSDNNKADFAIQNECELELVLSDKDVINDDDKTAFTIVNGEIISVNEVEALDEVVFSFHADNDITALNNYTWSVDDENRSEDEVFRTVFNYPGIYSIGVDVSNGTESFHYSTEVVVLEHASGLLFSEIAFKEQGDWIELYVAKEGVYDGYKLIEGGSVIAQIPDWGVLDEGDYIVFSDIDGSNIGDVSAPDDLYYEVIFDKNITGTDSSLMIQDSYGGIVDAVIWSNGNGSYTKNKSVVTDIIQSNKWDDVDVSITDEEDLLDSTLLSKGMSFIRLAGQETSHTVDDWFVTYEQTKGVENIYVSELPKQETQIIREVVVHQSPGPAPKEMQSTVTESSIEFTPIEVDDIIISEIMYAPESGSKEWVELYNASTYDIDLEGSTLEEGAGYSTSLSGLLSAHEYKIFNKASLNNNGDVVVLKDSSGTVVDQVSYGDWGGNELNAINVRKGNTLSRIDVSMRNNRSDVSLFASGISTPNEKNIIEIVESKEGGSKGDSNPDDGVGGNDSYVDGEVVIDGIFEVGNEVTLDASDITTLYPIEDYLWLFSTGEVLRGKSVDFLSQSEGVIDVELMLVDTYGQVQSLEYDFVISKREVIVDEFSNTLRLSEFLPNPDGSDSDSEFIELFNPSSKSIDLNGLILDDSDGGSREFGLTGMIDPGEYRVFMRNETGIALNNGADEVRLLTTSGKVLDSISYDTAQSGFAYALIGDSWQWTAIQTPGQPNSYQKDEEEDEIQDNISDNGIAHVMLSELQDIDIDQRVMVSGVALNTVNNAKKNVVYLQDESGVGYIYVYNKELPEVNRGQYIDVIGTVREDNGVKYLKLLKDDTIGVVMDTYDIFVNTYNTADLDDLGELSYIEVAGSVIEVGKSSVVIEDEEGDLNVDLQYVKTFIKDGLIFEGATVQLRGIMLANGSQRTLLIIDPDDVDVQRAVVVEKDSSMAAFTTNQDIDEANALLTTESTRVNPLYLLTVVLGLTVCGLLGFIIYSQGYYDRVYAAVKDILG